LTLFACGEYGLALPVYANGGSHVLEFRGVFPAAGTSFTSFMVDDVRLESCPGGG
jgi:hypothetical protein